jgi:hypothetical protein
MTEEEAKELIEKNNLSWDDFLKWMVGQTLTSDGKGNVLYFPHDVERYIALKVYGKTTYWD